MARSGLLKQAHMLRWRSRPHAQLGSVTLAGSPELLAKRSTPRGRAKGAASRLDVFEQPARSSESG